MTFLSRTLLLPSCLSLFLLMQVSACGSEEPDADAGSGGSSASGGAPSADGGSAAASNWEEVRNSFGLLSTLAGSGSTDVADAWRPEFEGGDALTAELSRPHIALADTAGNIYIADKESHGIRKVSIEGIITTVAGTNVAGDAPDEEGPALEGALSSPNGLWVQADGTFYIVDLGNNKIRKVTPSGIMSTLLQVDSLSAGRGLWVAPDESEVLIAAGTRLLRWTPDEGTNILATGFVSLGMVLRDPEGRLLVGDRDGNKVYEVDQDGTLIEIAGNGASFPFVDGAPALETALDEPRAIWPHKGGLFVGSHDSSLIFYVDDQGFAHLFLDGENNAHGGDGEVYSSPGKKVSEVRSLSVTPSGDLLIVENDNGYLRVVRALK